jgi:transcriptional regulator with XRE-family HTH domain
MKRLTSRSYPDLKTWRTASGLTQIEAAKLLGITQGYYGRLELKQKTTTGKRAKGMTEVTGVPIEVLVGAV